MPPSPKRGSSSHGCCKFVLFESALTSRPLFVNPSLVRAVVDGDQMGQGKICFDDQQSYGSRYGDENSTKIDGRIGADHAAPRIGPTEISGAQAFTGRRAIHQDSGQSFDERCQDVNASGSADG